MKTSERIRNLREDFDYTQTEIAKLVHVAQTTYSDYENGKVRISVDTLIALAKIYDVDPNYISGISNIKKHFPNT